MNTNNNSREYTTYQIQDLFSNLFYVKSLLKENKNELNTLTVTGETGTVKYSNLEKKNTELSKINSKLEKEAEYIIENPSKIIIREVPLTGILNQRRLVNKLNMNVDNKIRKLREMYYDVKDKFNINNNYIPEEYSTKYLDRSIEMHKKSVRQLLKLKEKLTGRKEDYSIEKNNSSFLDKLFNCPSYIDKTIDSLFIENNENMIINEKEQKLQKEEKELRQKEKKIIQHFKKFLDGTFKMS